MDSYRLVSFPDKTVLYRQLKILLLVFMLVSWGWTVFAQDSDEIEDRVRSISHQLRCPTCQSMSVKESDAGLSQNMKDKIREMLQEGMSEEEILRFFEDRYGEWILRSPKKQGFNLVLWLAPLVLLIIASLILVRTLLKRSRPAEKKQFTPLSPSEQSRLEKDLDRFETD